MPSIPPYKPRFLSRFFEIIEALPVPTWLLSLVIIVAAAVTQHWAAWDQGLIPQGEFNLHIFMVVTMVIAVFAGLRFGERAAVNALSDFSKLTRKTPREQHELAMRFLSIPLIPAILFLVIGFILGVYVYSTGLAGAIPIASRALPVLNAVCWGIVNAISLMLFVRAIHQMNQMRSLLDELKLDLFSLGPIYVLSGFSAKFAAIWLGFAYGLNLISLPQFFFTMYGQLLMGVISILGFLYFLIPLMRINTRMRAEKQRLLDELGKRQRQLHERLMQASNTRSLSGIGALQTAIEALSHHRTELQKLPTWPWQPIAIRGLATTMLLPILTYLVQRLLGAGLGL
jgi:hypothetical protein